MGLTPTYAELSQRHCNLGMTVTLGGPRTLGKPEEDYRSIRSIHCFPLTGGLIKCRAPKTAISVASVRPWSFPEKRWTFWYQHEALERCWPRPRQKYVRAAAREERIDRKNHQGRRVSRCLPERTIFRVLYGRADRISARPFADGWMGSWREVRPKGPGGSGGREKGEIVAEKEEMS